MLGCQPIVDRNDGYVELARGFGAIGLVRLEIADDEAAAMIKDHDRAGFAGVDSPGRLEVLRGGPTILVDAAHNPAGAAVLVEAMREAFTFTKLVGVVGVLQEKDAEGILDALEPILDEIVVTRTSSPRAIPAEELGELAEEIFGEDRVHVRSHLVDALDEAIGLVEAGGAVGGGVLATGSVTMAADVRTLLKVH